MALVATGGTIASRFSGEHGGLLSTDGADVLRGMAGLPDVALRVEEFCNLGSNLIDLPLALRLSRRIAALLADPDVSGCVVTHGTDTMEESAFLASLVVGSDKPVAFTGAQFAADSAAPDGPANLASALLYVAAPEARGLGPVIVFDGHAYAAEDATKIDAQGRAAFDGPHWGSVARIGSDSVQVTAQVPRREAIDAAAIVTDVALVPMAMGMGGRFIDGLVAAGAAGIIIEGFGCGNATPAVVAAVARARDRGVPTVVTTRCLRGETRAIYAEGGGLDLRNAGAVLAGRLQGRKARILLALLMAAGADLTKGFARYQICEDCGAGAA
ncbi:asparaginase [Tabrizicola sp.]|uniref:asparaginase n=1 Tax=Tabrizicola sp. TaxID=2005166 RepID=UPI0035B0C04B